MRDRILLALSEIDRPMRYSVLLSVYVAESSSSDDDGISNVVRDVDPIDGNPAMADRDYLVKKYTAMQRKYHLLEIEYDRLVVAHQALKANSLREFTPAE